MGTVNTGKNTAASTGATSGIVQHMRTYAPRQIVLLLMAAGFVTLFYDRLSALEMDKIWIGFRSVSFYQWIMALTATAVSFWAVGRYDTVVHRMIGTQTDSNLTHRAGIAGIAISQTLGMGVLTGALVRWRMLPDTTLWQATRLSAAVAVSFLAGWAVVTGLALLLLTPDIWGGRMIAVLPVIAAIALVMASLHGHSTRIFNRQIKWPSLTTIASIFSLAVIDTVAAAAALYVLLPEAVALPFGTLYPAFLLAFGAAMVSGTPGGVGPFEVTLLALLPSIGAEPVLGAVLAYRVVYYALPAVIAVIILARGPIQTCRQPITMEMPSKPEQRVLIQNAPFAEANLLRQGHKKVLLQNLNRPLMLVSQTNQALISLRDPIHDQSAEGAVQCLLTAARKQARIACLYKCGARTAVQARQQGLFVLPIAREAWLDPRNFTTATPNHRQLRRKLRKAQTAGITTTHTTTLPLADMARVSAEWVAKAGGERGFSMGVFTPEFVQSQRCYLAMHKGNLIGFISLNTCHAEWSLDLMRQTATAPDGTMHALLEHALKDAATHGLPRFSLAAIPFEHSNKLLHKSVQSASASTGLKQFKSAFAPHWQTLYMAAPNRLQFTVAAFDIAREITGKTGSAQASRIHPS